MTQIIRGVILYLMNITERLPLYKPPIPDDLRQRYEEELSGVERWRNQLLPTKEPENDLQHVRRMHVILDEIRERYSSIVREVDFETTAHMIYVHDGGEIISKDLSRSHPDYDGLRPRHKKKERAGFRWMTRNISDIELKAHARRLYERAEEKAPDDKEAQLTDVIDKVQAARFGLVNVFHGDMIGRRDNINTRTRRNQQLNLSITILMAPLMSSYNSLQTPLARREMKEFAIGEVGRFTAHGYSNNEVRPYLEMLYPLNPYSVATKPQIR